MTHGSPYAEGVTCSACSEDARHKVGEEDGPQERHNYTTYLCCGHFSQLMGVVARRECRHAASEQKS